MRRKVVVTGAGVVSAVGDSPADLTRALMTGRRAFAIDRFDPARYFGTRNTRPLDRTAQLVAAAAGFALADACCTADYRAGHTVGLVLGTVFAGVRTICAFDRRAIEVGPEYASPLDFANTVLNAAAGQAAIWHNLRGPNATIAVGGASGLQAVAYGAELIAAGAADAVLAGGADERSPEALAALERAGFVASDETASPPFAADRSRTRLGEGAAFVMLEADGTAQRRGARVRAEIRGFASGLAVDDDARVDAELVAGVLRTALADAGVNAAAIDAVGSAAGGNAEVDECEARALVLAFRGREGPVPVMNVKAAVGETLGASGALQVVAMLEAMRTGVLPGEPPLVIRTALIDAIGWDGHCSALIIGSQEAAAGQS